MLVPYVADKCNHLMSLSAITMPLVIIVQLLQNAHPLTLFITDDKLRFMCLDPMG